MRIPIESIEKGKCDGMSIWICDITFDIRENRELRHIKPTRVLVRSNSDSDKRIYTANSVSHFLKYGRNMNITKTVIKTRQVSRYRTGGAEVYDPVFCFEDEQSCIEEYDKLLVYTIDKLEKQKTLWAKELTESQDALKKEFFKK